jgi:hypothetical protein
LLGDARRFVVLVRRFESCNNVSKLQNAKMCSDWQASLSPKMKNAGIVAYIPPLLLVTVTLFSTDHPVFPDTRSMRARHIIRTWMVRELAKWLANNLLSIT